MKKTLCILTSAAICCGIPFPRMHAAATEGSCGEHAAWSYENGILTVTGTGAMTDYPDPALLREPTPEQQVPWHDYASELKSVVIGDGITHVGDNAFMWTTALETVTLPDSLLSLGDNAFYCSALPAVTLPANLETLGSGCFVQSKMTTVDFPASVRSLGDFCFSNSGLTTLTVPDTVQSVGNFCFASCRALTAATLPDTEIQLGSHLFDCCNQLETVHLPEPLTALPDYAFFACLTLESITFPSGCTVIGEAAFMDCKNLAEVHMSEACKELKRNCFMGCTALTEFKLPDTVETIGDSAFFHSSLKEIRLSKNLKTLGKSCFEQARLNSVTLPEGLTEIGPRCFIGTMIENIVIPESVRSVGDECFSMCNNLCTAVFPDTDIRLGQKLFWMCSALRSVHLPEPMLRIPDGLFYFCSMLKEVNIPAGCIAIEAEVFFACETLETVTIPRRCREIGDFCFKGCMWLEEIELPEVCTTLGAHCFEGCSRLKSLRIPDSITALGEGMLTNCSELTELTLSNSLTEFSFTDIIGTEKLKKLVIPESVQKITYALGSDTPAMSNRFGLTDLTLPKRKDLEIKPFSIPFSVLNSSKEPIVYGDSILYYWCGDSREITVPDGIKSIGMYAFEKNGVDILTIPPSVQKIDPNALVHTFSVRKIRGACLSAAHAFAVEHEIEFEPTEDAPEPQGAPIPHYDSSNLPFGNNGGIFGDTYDISNWQRSLLFSSAPSRSRMEKKMAEEWQGSCYGLSAVTILVRAGLLPLAALDPEAKTLSDVRPTKQAIQLINYYQMSADIVGSRLDVGSEYSSVKILNALRFAEEANQGGLPFLISFSSPGGDHAVVGYGLEAGSWTFGGKEYDRRIPIWDSNYAEPNDSAALYISSIDLTYTIPAYNLVYEDIFSEHKLIFVIGTPASLNIAPYREPALAAGDLNGSGEPDVSDAMEALRAYTNNMAGFLDELTVDQKYAADVNGDTLLTVEDAQLILKFYTQSTVAGKAVTWESLLAQ